MTIKIGVSAIVAIAMFAALLPTAAFAAPAGASSPPSRPDLHAAIHRAAVQAASQQPAPITLGRPASQAVRKQSTGGGHTMMIISLVSTVAGIAATYYVVKQMQKTTKTVQSEQ
jgi:hypothetical protein